MSLRTTSTRLLDTSSDVLGQRWGSATLMQAVPAPKEPPALPPPQLRAGPGGRAAVRGALRRGAASPAGLGVLTASPVSLSLPAPRSMRGRGAAAALGVAVPAAAPPPAGRRQDRGAAAPAPGGPMGLDRVRTPGTRPQPRPSRSARLLPCSRCCRAGQGRIESLSLLPPPQTPTPGRREAQGSLALGCV